MDPRRLLPEFFDAALRAVDGRACVERALRNLELPERIVVFAVGKAASSMWSGAHEALGDRIVRGLLITKDGHADPALRSHAHLDVRESAHPLPDERSLAAGEALISAIQALREDEFPLFLVSGGSSALVESLSAGVSLEDLRALNQRGLASGWNITQLNAERSKLSRLKGGGVARLLGERTAIALFVSDVLTDDPDIIGSGLLGVSPGSRDQITRFVVAGVDDAVTAVVASASPHGLTLERLDGHIEGDVTAVAEHFLERLRHSECDGVVWGGESTVTLPDDPGRGGRNQHLALLLARAIRSHENIAILAAGTDGTDGPTDDAGAIVDAGTITRAELGGVDVERAVKAFDSNLALEAAEDLLHTGPTGTNVGDLLIGLRKRDRVRDPAFARVI
jgi:glycerate 2-kinase